MTKIPPLAYALPLVVLLIVAFTSVAVIEPGHRGVRVTLGRVGAEPLGEGAAFKWPLGISHVEELNVQQQKVDGDTACFSSDLQTVKIQYAVMYRLAPAHVVSLFQDFRGEPYPSLVAPRVQEALKQTTAKYTAEALVQKREQMREETLGLIRTAIGAKIEIVDFNVVNIDLSDQLEQAIEAKMVQQQTSLKKEFELDSERKEAEIVAVKAEAEAKAVKIRGEALVSNPLVLQLEVIKKWNGISPTTVVLGQQSDGSQVLLPIVAPPAGRRQ